MLVRSKQASEMLYEEINSKGNAGNIEKQGKG